MRITPNQLRSVKIVRVSFSLHRLDRSQKKLQFSDFKKTELEISNVDTYPETVFFLAFLVRTIRPGRTLFPARKCKLDVKIPTNSSLGKLARRTSIKNFSPNIVPIRKNFNTLRSKSFPFNDDFPRLEISELKFLTIPRQNVSNFRGRFDVPIKNFRPGEYWNYSEPSISWVFQRLFDSQTGGKMQYTRRGPRGIPDRTFLRKTKQPKVLLTWNYHSFRSAAFQLLIAQK